MSHAVSVYIVDRPIVASPSDYLLLEWWARAATAEIRKQARLKADAFGLRLGKHGRLRPDSIVPKELPKQSTEVWWWFVSTSNDTVEPHCIPATVPGMLNLNRLRRVPAQQGLVRGSSAAIEIAEMLNNPLCRPKQISATT